MHALHLSPSPLGIDVIHGCDSHDNLLPQHPQHLYMCPAPRPPCLSPQSGQSTRTLSLISFVLHQDLPFMNNLPHLCPIFPAEDTRIPQVSSVHRPRPLVRP